MQQEVRTFAVRRVNPFLGVLQVVETDTGRAISVNGVVWDIEIGVPVQDGWGSLNRNSSRLAYYRYGLWSEQEGLVNRPLAPHLESDPLKEQADFLIQSIRNASSELPFTLQDIRELWLFDQNNENPIALLSTARKHVDLPSPEPKYWSASVGSNGVASQRRYPQSQELEQQVKQYAGFNMNKHWIERAHDGSGMMLRSGHHLAEEMFPPFLLTENWPDELQHKLAADFIDWTAPSLLTLQHLGNGHRERLEKVLSIQSQSIEHHWKLYPKILHGHLINTARVKCRLQQGAAPEGGDT